jgi:hypothetical protein
MGLGHDPWPLLCSVSSGHSPIGEIDVYRIAVPFGLVIRLQRAAQPIHLCSYVRRSLCPNLVRPEFADYQLSRERLLRIHIRNQEFEKLSELSLIYEGLTVQDFFDLITDLLTDHARPHSFAKYS